MKNIFKLILSGVMVTLLLVACSSASEEGCTATTWYEDADDDGLGNPEVSLTSCTQPDGFVDNSDDEDDTE